MIKCLYLTRNGLLEPLGQSQVLPYLRGLSKHYSFTLITYEKDRDFLDKNRMLKIKKECDSCGIDWLPQRFNGRFENQIGALICVFHMVRIILSISKVKDIKLIHTRSYIPALAALIIKKIKKTPFIFDMRALWPEELITAKRIKRSSIMHRLIVYIERLCIKYSDSTISLTYASANYLKKKYSVELKNKKINIIPTCADLMRFSPDLSRSGETEIHGCIGTITSGWFRTDWLSAWFKEALILNKNAKFEIVTQDNTKVVRDMIDPNNELNYRLTISSKSPEQMPDVLRKHNLSIMFYAGGEISELGRCPTRMAEALGCGIPIVANEGVGDVADIIKDKRVGVILKNSTREEIHSSIKELKILMNDPSLLNRCRSVAEEIFSLKSGTSEYLKIYNSIVGKKCVE